MPTIGTRFTRSASQPIGIAPSTKNRLDADGDEDDRAAADVERAPEFGLDHLHRVQRDLVERDQQPEDDEHQYAALGERLLNDDRLGVDARQQVVGEDDLLLGARLRVLARRLFVEDGGGERRGVAAARRCRRRSVTIVSSVSSVAPRRRRCRDRTRFLTRVSGRWPCGASVVP